MVIIGHRSKSTFGANIKLYKNICLLYLIDLKERAIKAAFLKGDYY